MVKQHLTDNEKIELQKKLDEISEERDKNYAGSSIAIGNIYKHEYHKGIGFIPRKKKLAPKYVKIPKKTYVINKPKKGNPYGWTRVGSSVSVTYKIPGAGKWPTSIHGSPEKSLRIMTRATDPKIQAQKMIMYKSTFQGKFATHPKCIRCGTSSNSFGYCPVCSIEFIGDDVGVTKNLANQTLKQVKGHCAICGKVIRRRRGSRRQPKYCEECAKIKIEYDTKLRENRRYTVSNRHGTVPFRAEPFKKYLINNHKDNVFRENTRKKHLIRVINEGIWTDIRKEQKGVEPDRTDFIEECADRQSGCEECGGELELFNEHVTKRNKPKGWKYPGGKIGGWKLACVRCGLVPNIKAVKEQVEQISDEE